MPCPRSSYKPEVEPAGLFLGYVTHGGVGLKQLHRVMLNGPWALQGQQQGLGQRGCLLCCLHYLGVAVAQSPTNVMWPGQREALNQLCASAPSPRCWETGEGQSPESCFKALNCLRKEFPCCWVRVLSPLWSSLAPWLLLLSKAGLMIVRKRGSQPQWGDHAGQKPRRHISAYTEAP